MFPERLPRPWPSCALLFTLLIAVCLTCGEAALAQAPAAVPAATPAPASSIPSVPAPTPAGQSTTDQQQPSVPAQSQPVTPSATTPEAPQQPAPSTPDTNAQPSTSQPAPPAVTPPDQLEQPIHVPQAPTAPAPSQVDMPPAVPVASVPSIPAYGPVTDEVRWDPLGSTYIPVDSIVYPLALRLYSMGYLNTAFIAMRPWTRRSLLHMLEESANEITADGDPEAMEILAKLQDAIVDETPGKNLKRGAVYGVDSVYT